MLRQLLVVSLSLLMTSMMLAQTSKFTLLKSGAQINNPKEVSATGLELFIVQVNQVPDLTAYDLVTATLQFPELSSKKYPVFFQDTGEQMYAICKDSKKVPGTKYLQMVITTDPKGQHPNIGFFKHDAYPFSKAGFEDYFSKDSNQGLDHYTMTFVLTAQKIVKYNEQWEDGVLKKVPVYGEHIALTEPISVQLKTY